MPNDKKDEPGREQGTAESQRRQPGSRRAGPDGSAQRRPGKKSPNDPIDEASEESFPASDPPAFGPSAAAPTRDRG